MSAPESAHEASDGGAEIGASASTAHVAAAGKPRAESRRAQAGSTGAGRGAGAGAWRDVETGTSRGLTSGDAGPGREVSEAAHGSGKCDGDAGTGTAGGSSVDRMAEAFSTVLKEVGEDPSREGLQKTPMRAAKALAFCTSGYNMDLRQLLNGALFNETGSDGELVIVRNVELYSLCEHHMLPFFGHAHVAYVPNGRIIGLSKIARVVDMFARRLQVQERLTREIADAIQSVLEPMGVAVMLEATHMCMAMRGVEKSSSTTTTTCYLGAVRTNSDLRREFLALVARP